VKTPRTTIQGKLMTAIMSTSLAVLVLASACFITYEVVTFRKNVEVGLATRAEIIAANCTAALAFQNPADATDVLETLDKDPRTLAASLYDAGGHLFAKYPANAPDNTFPAQPGSPGHRYEGRDFILFQPVMQGDRRLGTIYLRFRLSQLNERYRAYSMLVLVIFAAAMLLAFVLSNRLKRRIAQPVMELAGAAREISERRDYTIRTPSRSDDEIGVLTDSFNDMLDEIQRRDTAVRQSEARLRAILASALDGIVTMNHEGKIVEFNPAAELLFGHPRAAAVGTSLIDLMVPAHLQQRYRRALERYFRRPYGGRDERLELVARRADGSEVPVEVAIQRVRHEGPPMYTAFIRDITERKRAEQEIHQLNAELELRVLARTAELEAANKELEGFSYSVSHDLRAPLRAIEGFSEMLIEDHGDKLDETGKRYLSQVRTSTHHMSQLIDNLLNLARISRAEFRRQNVDLSVIAREVAEALCGEQPERKVDFEIAPDLTVEGDPQLLRVVMDNLLRNAWKFTSKHPTARVEVGRVRRGGRPVFFVKDDGAGFDMGYAKNLFSPFQRLHRQTDFEGTGVGLATVQRVIHRHGGRLWAEAAVERGATFFFTLWDSTTGPAATRAASASGMQGMSSSARRM
jgi:PAS domain S-box-containing protein